MTEIEFHNLHWTECEASGLKHAIYWNLYLHMGSGGTFCISHPEIPYFNDVTPLTAGVFYSKHACTNVVGNSVTQYCLCTNSLQNLLVTLELIEDSFSLSLRPDAPMVKAKMSLSEFKTRAKLGGLFGELTNRPGCASMT